MNTLTETPWMTPQMRPSQSCLVVPGKRGSSGGGDGIVIFWRGAGRGSRLLAESVASSRP